MNKAIYSILLVTFSFFWLHLVISCDRLTMKGLPQAFPDLTPMAVDLAKKEGVKNIDYFLDYSEKIPTAQIDFSHKKSNELNQLLSNQPGWIILDGPEMVLGGVHDSFQAIRVWDDTGYFNQKSISDLNFDLFKRDDLIPFYLEFLSTSNQTVKNVFYYDIVYYFDRGYISENGKFFGSIREFKQYSTTVNRMIDSHRVKSVQTVSGYSSDDYSMPYSKLEFIDIRSELVIEWDIVQNIKSFELNEKSNLKYTDKVGNVFNGKRKKTIFRMIGNSDVFDYKNSAEIYNQENQKIGTIEINKDGKFFITTH